MFANKDFYAVGFNSSWVDSRSCSEAEVQTTEINSEDIETQSLQRDEKETQTSTSQQSANTNVDEEKLAKWLERVTPLVLKELDERSKCRAFQGYKLQDIDSNRQMKLVYSLSLPELSYEVLISSLRWSCTGGVLAISPCARDHPDWCDHSGSIFLYHLNRQDFKADVPNRTLEMSSCVTCVCPHPTEAYILACGTFSGEVTIWNLQREEAVVLGTSTLHCEAVSHMEWVRNLDSNRPLLTSGAKDGSLVVWSLKLATNNFKLSHGYFLHSDKTESAFGVVCASFCPLNPSQFVVGVEGGSILLCSTVNSKPILRNPNKLDIGMKNFRDPIVAVLNGHKGAISSIQWLSNKTDTFLSCGTDSELHIYSVLQTAPLRVIFLPEVAMGLIVCPSAPSIIAFWGTSDIVYLYDIKADHERCLLKVQDSSDHIQVCKASFSSTQSQLLSVGDANGRIKVWQVPYSKLLNEIAE